MAVPECAHRLMRCRPSLVRGRAAQVNPGGFTTPARRPSVPHRTAGCGKSSLRPLMAGSSPSLPDGSNPSAAIVQSASDVQCSRLLKTTELRLSVLYFPFSEATPVGTYIPGQTATQGGGADNFLFCKAYSSVLSLVFYQGGPCPVFCFSKPLRGQILRFLAIS